jgi:hypothetical protein
MKYLLWQCPKGWHPSRTDGKSDELTLNCLSKQTLETHCHRNNIEYDVYPMTASPEISDGYEYLREYAPQ